MDELVRNDGQDLDPMLSAKVGDLVSIEALVSRGGIFYTINGVPWCDFLTMSFKFDKEYKAYERRS